MQQRATHGATGPAGSALLGQGESSDVWGIKNYALKLYRINTSGLDVRFLMDREIDTYNRLDKTNISPLSALHYYEKRNVEDIDGEICGFAIFDKFRGTPLTINEIIELSNITQKLWINSLIRETILIEKALSQCEPALSWDNSYAALRIATIKKWSQERKLISDSDLNVALDIMHFIESQVTSKIYIHGDFNLPNIIVDLNRLDQNGLAICLIDPLISKDPPEANWRHFTMAPNVALKLADEYQTQRNVTFNEKLMFAIGALTYLYMANLLYKRNRHEALKRRSYFENCLSFF